MRLQINWKVSHSLLPPDQTERIKEGYLVRKDIHIEELPSNPDVGDSEEPSTEVVYDEAFLTDAEYATYLAERNKADLDYLAMEMEVEL